MACYRDSFTLLEFNYVAHILNTVLTYYLLSLLMKKYGCLHNQKMLIIQISDLLENMLFVKHRNLELFT
jgi:hypothetical protein